MRAARLVPHTSNRRRPSTYGSLRDEQQANGRPRKKKLWRVAALCSTVQRCMTQTGRLTALASARYDYPLESSFRSNGASSSHLTSAHITHLQPLRCCAQEKQRRPRYVLFRRRERPGTSRLPRFSIDHAVTRSWRASPPSSHLPRHFSLTQDADVRAPRAVASITAVAIETDEQFIDLSAGSRNRGRSIKSFRR